MFPKRTWTWKYKWLYKGLIPRSKIGKSYGITARDFVSSSTSLYFDSRWRAFSGVSGLFSRSFSQKPDSPIGNFKTLISQNFHLKWFFRVRFWVGRWRYTVILALFETWSRIRCPKLFLYEHGEMLHEKDKIWLKLSMEFVSSLENQLRAAPVKFLTNIWQ